MHDVPVFEPRWEKGEKYRPVLGTIDILKLLSTSKHDWLSRIFKEKTFSPTLTFKLSHLQKGMTIVL